MSLAVHSIALTSAAISHALEPRPGICHRRAALASYRMCLAPEIKREKALDIARRRFSAGDWWIWLYRDGTGEPSSWERYSVRSREDDEIVIDMSTKFEAKDAYHTHHRFRLSLARCLTRNPKDWEFSEFSYCREGSFCEAPHRDNTQAFEEKFDCFLMQSALPAVPLPAVKVLREREQTVRGVGEERTTLVQSRRHEYTSAWYVREPRRLAGVAGFKAFGPEGRADTYTFELVATGGAQDPAD